MTMITGTIALVAGLVLGFLVALTMGRATKWYVVIDLVLGAGGGLLGAWLFFNVFGFISTSSNVNAWLAIVWSIIGVVVLEAVAGVFMPMESEEKVFERPERMYPRGIAHEFEEKLKSQNEKEESRGHEEKK